MLFSLVYLEHKMETRTSKALVRHSSKVYLNHLRCLFLFELSSIFIHDMTYLKPRVLFKINRLQILNTRQCILYTPHCTSLLKSIKCIPLDEFFRNWAWWITAFWQSALALPFPTMFRWRPMFARWRLVSSDQSNSVDWEQLWIK